MASLNTELDCLERKVDEYYGYLNAQHTELENKIDSLSSKVEQYYLEVKEELKPPEYLDTYALNVGTTPIPLSDVDRIVKKIHIKVPSWSPHLLYIGSPEKQEFVLEPRDREVLEVKNPKNVYVYSLGNVTIYVMLEY